MGNAVRMLQKIVLDARFVNVFSIVSAKKLPRKVQNTAARKILALVLYRLQQGSCKHMEKTERQ